MTPDQQTIAIHRILGYEAPTRPDWRLLIPDYLNDPDSMGALIARMVGDGHRISLDYGKRYYSMTLVGTTHVMCRRSTSLTRLVAGMFMDLYAETLQPPTVDVRPLPPREVIALPDTADA